MNKEFVNYNSALALKELGFDEPCFISNMVGELKDYIGPKESTVPMPLYQQAFRWLRNKYLTYGIIMPTNVSEIQGIDCILEIHPPPDKNGIVYILEDGKLYTSYEEAEQACLDKLIEIVKEKTQ